jgi:uncharacterized protein YxeA
MKKVKIVITSVVVLAIVGSAFAFNAKKTGKFCTTTSGGTGNCQILEGSKRTTAAGTQFKYVQCWEYGVCNNTSPCNTLATFIID